MFALIFKRCSLAGSLIGPPREIKQMLELFAEKGVRTWNNNVPMRDANKAVVDMVAERLDTDMCWSTRNILHEQGVGELGQTGEKGAKWKDH